MRVFESTADGLVPLAERFRGLVLVRLAIAAVMLAGAVLLPAGPGGTPLALLAVVTAGWLGLSAAAAVAWRVSHSRRLGVALLSLLLLPDGLYLAWATYGTGGVASPLRALILLHLVAVTLLASFRTGMKLALWHSLLLLSAFHAQDAGLRALGGRPLDLVAGGLERVGVELAAFWLVAVLTAATAAVNERELRRRRLDLEALARLAERLEGAAGVGEVAEALAAAVRDDLDYDRVAVLGERGAAGELELLAHHGVAAGSPRTVTARPGGPLAAAVERRRTVLASRPGDELAVLLPAARNVAVVPMQAEGRVVGAVVIEHALRTGSRIERRVLSILERYASQAALALANARLLARLQHSAATDGLTGLANRRHLDEQLARAWAAAVRDDTPLSAVLLDLDHFKRLNDEHGHQIGDEVLRATGRALDEHTRAMDLPARYGGEEFCVLLPGADAGVAHEAAERLRSVIAALPTPVPVSASLGVATFPGDAADPAALLEAADRALYAAKRGGRDRVERAAHVPSAG